MDLARSDRIFSNFLEASALPLEGGSDRMGIINRLRERVPFGERLRARRARRAASDEAFTMWQQSLEAGGALGFFEWLMANADEIFALIARIMALFGL